MSDTDWKDSTCWRPRIGSVPFVIGKDMIICAFGTKYEVLWIDSGIIELMKPSEVEYHYSRAGIEWYG